MHYKQQQNQFKVRPWACHCKKTFRTITNCMVRPLNENPWQINNSNIITNNHTWTSQCKNTLKIITSCIDQASEPKLNAKNKSNKNKNTQPMPKRNNLWTTTNYQLQLLLRKKINANIPTILCKYIENKKNYANQMSRITFLKNFQSWSLFVFQAS